MFLKNLKCARVQVTFKRFQVLTRATMLIRTESRVVKNIPDKEMYLEKIFADGAIDTVVIFGRIARSAYNVTQRPGSVQVALRFHDDKEKGVVAFLLIDFLGTRNRRKYFKSRIPGRDSSGVGKSGRGEASFVRDRD